MKKIKLQKLTLTNFKCHKSLVVEFDGQNASIYGDNATGKTSLYDGFLWCLFGKDSAGNSDKVADIKPLNERGEVADHEAITEVEAVLSVDGDTKTLHRSLQEVWTTKRGREESTYDGNVSSYAINGVPMKANAYATAVEEMVGSEELFLLLTRVNYFPSIMPWQKRREILFDITGICEDRVIMETDDKFAPVLEAMGKGTPEDLKKKLAAEKKALLVTKNTTPARISENQKIIDALAETDFDLVAREKADLEEMVIGLETNLLAIQNNSAIQEAELKRREVTIQIKNLDEENRLYRQGQERAAKTVDVVGLQAGLKRWESRLQTAIARVKFQRSEVERYQGRIATERQNWIEKNAIEFTGDSCPTCGQTLPAAILEAEKTKWEKAKAAVLESIQRNAELDKKALVTAQANLEAAIEECVEIENEIARRKDELAEAEKAEAATPVIMDMPDYTEKKAVLLSFLADAEEYLASLKDNSAAEESKIKVKIRECRDDIAALGKTLGEKAALEYAVRRMDELREEAAKAAEKLRSVESILFLLEDYARYKTSFVEESVNSMFRLAQFRLFREQANGGVEDRCDVTVDGVPYVGLNNGMRINVGLDIVNTLSRHFGVYVPLWIDNAESVTNLETSDTQVIRLVVSENDKEVRVQL